MFYCGLLGLIQMYFDKTRSIKLDADSLSYNFGWVAQVLQNAIMHGGQGTAVIQIVCHLGIGKDSRAKDLSRIYQQVCPVSQVML